MKNVERTAITPPELARRWGVSIEKVHRWINTGQLRAFNAATNRGGRPRYRIFESDIEEFVSRRATTSSAQTSRPPRRFRKNNGRDIIQFFS